MISLSDRLSLNDKEVAAKVMDGEAIIINLSNGIYYSMGGVGGLIWELIEKEQSPKEIIAAITARYDVSSAQAQADVERLLTELTQEKLVVVLPDRPSRPETPQDQSQPKLPYESPQLSIYRDMGDLLALDPPTPGLEAALWQQAPTEDPSGEQNHS